VRAIAYKASVKTLLSGEFHPSPGDYEPSFVRVGGRKINRCNVVGTLVKPEVLDDGTGEIMVINFDGELGVKEGSVVRVIGKVRERDTGRYIAVESIHPLREEWLELRKLELEKQDDDVVEEAEAPKQEGEQEIDIEEIEV
jgi:RPA family protein